MLLGSLIRHRYRLGRAAARWRGRTAWVPPRGRIDDHGRAHRRRCRARSRFVGAVQYGSKDRRHHLTGLRDVGGGSPAAPVVALDLADAGEQGPREVAARVGHGQGSRSFAVRRQSGCGYGAGAGELRGTRNPRSARVGSGGVGSAGAAGRQLRRSLARGQPSPEGAAGPGRVGGIRRTNVESVKAAEAARVAVRVTAVARARRRSVLRRRRPGCGARRESTRGFASGCGVKPLASALLALPTHVGRGLGVTL